MVDPPAGRHRRCPIVAHRNARRTSPGRGPTAGLVLACASLVALSLSACGSSGSTLDAARVQKAIAASILAQRGLHTTVTCPTDVPVSAGRQFTCKAKLDVGAYPVTVTVTNSKGHVRYENRQPLIALNTAKVQHAIATSIAHQRGLTASVSCPAEVLQKAGIVFTCTAVVQGKGKHYPFTVTEVNDKGQVRYLGQ